MNKIPDVLHKIRPTVHNWTERLRWKELTGIATAAYFGGVQLAEYIHADSTKAQQAGVVLAAVAAVCYLLNPKYADWVEALPESPQTGQKKIGFRQGTPDDFSTQDGGHSNV